MSGKTENEEDEEDEDLPSPIAITGETRRRRTRLPRLLRRRRRATNAEQTRTSGRGYRNGWQTYVILGSNADTNMGRVVKGDMTAMAKEDTSCTQKYFTFSLQLEVVCMLPTIIPIHHLRELHRC